MEILITVVGKIAEYAVEPIGRQLGYVCFISNNIQNLKKHVEKLKETKESVQQKIYNAKQNAEDIKPNVENWLSKVDAIIEKCEQIFNEGQQVRLCSNLIQRHKLSRKAVKMVDEVVEIKDEGNFEEVSYNAPLSEYESTLRRESSFLYFESRNLVMEQIMDALILDSNKINRIGVHGMGGVGKTTLVEEISRKVMVKKSFNEVIKVVASKTIEPEAIQTQIAEKLNLNLTDTTVRVRALKLHKRLKDEKILIVIDDLWKEIDLDEIGIPSVADHSGCKILITSRNSDIFNYMCTNTVFKISDLQTEEAWNLFKKFAGEIVETSDWKPLVVEIVSKCARLPIVIITVAKALRNKHSSIWEDALDQLRNPVAVNIKGMETEVYFPLKLSYERLEYEEVKLLFLLCSMFPEDYSIDVEDLHVYAKSMGFLQGVATVAQGRRRIIKLVEDLISSSLLLQSESSKDNNHVKMHDTIRDVAIIIASTHDHIRTLCYSKEELCNEWEEEKISGNHTTVYLDFGGLSSLPQKLLLPKLQLLRLVDNQPPHIIRELEETFFEETKELKVLELKWFRISLMSPSFANVRSLHLFNCVLKNMDMIAELKRLEILKLGGYYSINIPIAISQLTQLKVLDLSLCDQLDVISPNVLSSLTKLEELYLRTFQGWELGEQVLNEGRKNNASLSELKYLQQLSTLELWIPDEKIMPKQLFSREVNFDRFDITIGRKQQRSENMRKFFKVLFLEMESGSCKDDWIKMLLKKSEELCLTGSIGAWILRFELDENESSNVKHLYIHNISEFQHLIHGEQKKPSRKALSNLRFLELKNLVNLESIVHGGHVREPSLDKLKVVKVQKCDKMSSLFFNSSLDDLLNLEKFEISHCEMLEVIMVLRSEDKATEKFEFAHLNHLELRNLPRLESFCFNIEELGQLVGTSNFSNAGSFLSEKVSLPNLETLVIAEVNLKMIFHNRLLIIPNNSFSKLKRVEIDSCNDLKNVFPSYIGSTLTCLKILEIGNCKIFEEVQEDQARVIKESVVLLPNLSVFKLFNLPNLEYVWSKDACDKLLTFENVRVLSICHCPKLKKQDIVKVLKQPEDLEIDFNDLKEILGEERLVQELELDQFEISKGEAISLQDRVELFSKLKYLNLCCHPPDYKSTHLPMEIVRIFHKLEHFRVNEISIEELLPIKRLIDVEEEHQNGGRLLKNNLVPLFSMSFRNLGFLMVQKCHGLTYLLTSSMARTLVHLNFLSIEECKKMTSVVAGDEDEDEDGNDEIVFDQLSHLSLFSLPNLTNFHSGKCTMRFPHLSTGFVHKCPKLKVFSHTTATSKWIGGVNIHFSNGGYCSSFSIVNNTKFEEDINVIVRQAWECLYGADADTQYLSIEQSLKENQSDPSSSHVEEQESY